MTRALPLFLALIFLFPACQKPVDNTSAVAKRYPFKGKVVSVNRNAKTAEIDHEAVEGLMPGMTMPFAIHADWVWDDLKPGSQIRAELVVDNAAKDP